VIEILGTFIVLSFLVYVMVQILHAMTH